MGSIWLAACLAICATGAAYAQQTVRIHEFEVASIKPSLAADGNSSGISTGHGRLDGHNVTLQRCIMGGYGIGPNQILGGPEWMASDRFDILAKAEKPVNDDSVLMEMLRGLLADRFKLAMHRETRSIPAFLLEVAKNGPKLEKAEDGEWTSNTSSSHNEILLNAQRTTMDHFAELLGRRMELPVVNRTGLDGIFNIKLHWTPARNDARPADNGALDGISVFDALQEQLGLHLRAQKVPIEVFVIDHVEKPSAN